MPAVPGAGLASTSSFPGGGWLPAAIRFGLGGVFEPTGPGTGRVTENGPGGELWVGFGGGEVEPSPKVHRREVVGAGGWSVKDTSSGALPLFGAERKFAT